LGEGCHEPGKGLRGKGDVLCRKKKYRLEGAEGGNDKGDADAKKKRSGE